MSGIFGERQYSFGQPEGELSPEALRKVEKLKSLPRGKLYVKDSSTLFFIRQKPRSEKEVLEVCSSDGNEQSTDKIETFAQSGSGEYTEATPEVIERLSDAFESLLGYDGIDIAYKK